MPHIDNPQQTYALMAQSYLPTGLVGLTLAGMFSHTMAMASSDANAISAVVTRDILPAVLPRFRAAGTARALLAARTVTVVFITVSMVVAIEADHFGGVLGIIVGMVAAVMGPISIPMLLGLLPAFRRCGPRAALSSWALGLGGYFLVKYGLDGASQTTVIATPLLTSLAVYTVLGVLLPEPDPDADAVVAAVSDARPDAGPAPLLPAVEQP
jgi:solute:Na+ symporter, SSS family